MNYPLISEYIEAIKSAEDNFKELTNLRPVLGEDGQPVMSSGNFAVVFKMKDERDEKLYAVKCFTKEQQRRAENYKKITEYLDMTSRYLAPVKYYEDELFVDSKVANPETFPVLLMDWVEGKPLDKYILDNLQYRYILQQLAYLFGEFSVWLRSLSLAHGDLKPDNIFISDNGYIIEIRLVDYDGMFVPSMTGQRAIEMGSPHFRHPLRNIDDFDKNIDDFSLISILLSLKIISNNPDLYKRYSTPDRLLFSDEDYRNFLRCNIINEITNDADSETTKLIGLLLIAIADKNISQVAPSCMRQSIPESLCKTWGDYEQYAHKGELWNSLWKDNFGARYSYDRKTIIKGANTKVFCIRKDVTEIAPCAFANIEDTGDPFYISLDLYVGDMPYKIGFDILEEVVLPKSLKSIGYYAFYGSNIKKINMPSSIISIGVNAFDSCKLLESVIISSSVSKIEDYTFSNCQSLTNITIPQSVRSIGSFAFRDCKKLEKVILTSVVMIKKDTFEGCDSLREIQIPKGQLFRYKRFMPASLRALLIEL